MYELHKKNEVGNLQIWKAEINNNTAKYTWGIKDGKIQSKSVTFKNGKNVGRSNETTPEQQCIFEVEIKVRKKLEQGFKLIQGQLTTISKTVVESDLDVPQPMLAKVYNDHRAKVDSLEYIYAQPKLDGNRCLINIKTGKLYSRKRKEITSIPHLGVEVQKVCKLLAQRCYVEYVDGELYSHDLTFNDIQSLVRRTVDIDEDKAKLIRFNMFDYVKDEIYEYRLKNIEKYVEPNEYVSVLPTYQITPNQIQWWHDKFVDQGYEGLIVRIPDMVYESKRSSALYKYKNFVDEEFEIIGMQSEKKDETKLGSVILKMKDGQIFNARPAMTDEEKAEMWKKPDSYVGKMATVKFQMKDEKTGIPRFPVLKGIRDSSDLDI